MAARETTVHVTWSLSAVIDPAAGNYIYATFMWNSYAEVK
jgi:hypothetical protein